MDSKNELKRRIEAGEFADNNGRIIRTINVLKGKWIKLSVAQSALSEIDEGDFEQSLIYLERAEYIKVRNIATKRCVEVDSADYDACEVTLTKRGIDLALYYINDPAVKV